MCFPSGETRGYTKLRTSSIAGVSFPSGAIHSKRAAMLPVMYTADPPAEMRTLASPLQPPHTLTASNAGTGGTGHATMFDVEWRGQHCAVRPSVDEMIGEHAEGDDPGDVEERDLSVVERRDGELRRPQRSIVDGEQHSLSVVEHDRPEMLALRASRNRRASARPASLLTPTRAPNRAGCRRRP